MSRSVQHSAEGEAPIFTLHKHHTNKHTRTQQTALKAKRELGPAIAKAKGVFISWRKVGELEIKTRGRVTLCAMGRPGARVSTFGKEWNGLPHDDFAHASNLRYGFRVIGVWLPGARAFRDRVDRGLMYRCDC